jgi:hypothetical protein
VAFIVIARVLFEARETDKTIEPKTIVPAFDALALYSFMVRYDVPFAPVALPPVGSQLAPTIMLDRSMQCWRE